MNSLRNALCALALVVAVASTGCDGNGGTADALVIVEDFSGDFAVATPADMAGSSADLVTPPDLAPAPPVNIQILAFNDFHGNLAPPSGSSGRLLAENGDPQVGDAGTPGVPDAGTQTVNAGGAAYLATHLAALKAQNPNTVVVHAGDLVGASPFVSAVFHDEPAVLFANQIGLDIASVGNHEFDHGITELLRLQYGGCHPVDGCKGPAPDGGVYTYPGANFEYLAANVDTDVKSGKTVLPKYIIKHFGSESVAFIGMTLHDTPTIVSASGVAGLTFVDEVTTVNTLVASLKAQGVSAIVVVVHQGGTPANNTPYDGCGISSGIIWDMANGFDPAVDVVVSAHTHQPYVCTAMGKLVTSASSYGRLITQIQLQIDPATHKVTSKMANQHVVTRAVTPDPTVKGIVDSYTALAAPVASRVVGHISSDLTTAPTAAGEEILGDVIGDAMLEATKDPKNGGAVLAIMNQGGIRADITYAPVGSEQPGEVTFGKCFTTQPFTNYLVALDITGQNLKNLLEEQWQAGGVVRFLQFSQNFSYTWSMSGAQGSRVDPASITINGQPINLAATYRVVTNSFLQTGGDGFSDFLMSKNAVTEAIDVDALIAYFGHHDPLTTPTPNHFIVKP